MFSDKTQMLIILVLAAAHVLVSGMMVVACFTSKDKSMKKLNIGGRFGDISERPSEQDLKEIEQRVKVIINI